MSYVPIPFDPPWASRYQTCDDQLGLYLMLQSDARFIECSPQIIGNRRKLALVSPVPQRTANANGNRSCSLARHVFLQVDKFNTSSQPLFYNPQSKINTEPIFHPSYQPTADMKLLSLFLALVPVATAQTKSSSSSSSSVTTSNSTASPPASSTSTSTSPEYTITGLPAVESAPSCVYNCLIPIGLADPSGCDDVTEDCACLSAPSDGML